MLNTHRSNDYPGNNERQDLELKGRYIAIEFVEISESRNKLLEEQ
jgi:hypothetical protein